MARYRSEDVANAFWEGAGGRARFGSPADVERAAARVLPVAVHRVASLHTGAVVRFLCRVGADPWLDGAPRPLRGCLIADAGKALILVDRDDPVDEQRMTIAHEVAHLLLHYLKPREEAVTAFGPRILAVLDRTRPATPGEKLSAALRNVPIEPFRHAMDRGHTGHAGVISAMEDEADDLAVELLAPWRELRAMRGGGPGPLRERFGLPAPVAARLAGVIGRPRTSPGVIGLFRQK
ncbi:hypothetical protein DFH01_25575 [Falsiroseomonas bella]|uniref:IrrE N-terminal-like domain-containing protein n=1 Tax=Falsiroseomonas bella TaxID=2184016 RepID=A0A317F8W4_9PROT|nr:ImmA/IrrE family metallo-endopeptidase [Falsiroseomonas bella]PWS34389.1 hypothetical protein DFH01_25575 [Falsiroseomonas bella]